MSTHAQREAPREFIVDLVDSFRFEDAELPSLPDAVVYLERALRNDTLSLAALAALIAKDPVLAARLIRVANSSYYRGVQPIENVSHAVVRLGAATTRNVSLLALRRAFTARHEAIARMTSSLWAESLRVASTASVLADYVPIVDGDRAMLGGLLYNVGPMLLLTQIDARLSATPDESVVGRILERHAARFGELLLRHWSMDPDLVAVAAHRDDWSREHEGVADLADLVLVAARCCRLTSEPGDGARDAVPERMPAVAKLAPWSRGEMSPQAVLEAANERIEETLAALAG